MAKETGEALRRAFEQASREGVGGDSREVEETVEILTFSLSGEIHGFRLRDLVEIIGGVEPTPIPFTPNFISGVINHRGSVVAVVDLKKIFGLTGPKSEDGRMVLVKSGRLVVSFQADEISDILKVAVSSIEPPLSTIEKGKADYIEGCIRLEQGLVVLLDSRALIHELRSQREGG